MRVLRLALAGGLVLTAPIAVQASPPGSNMGRAEVDRATGIERVGNGNGPGYHPMPNGWNGDWRRVPGPSRQWNGGWVSRRWWPNGPLSGWACCPRPGVPTSWVWGPSGGAFDYPFADWRGPTGGWGNP